MLSADEQRIADEAVQFARTHKKAIAKRIADPSVHPAERHPVAVFMAGSPGAGKTESARELIAKFEDEGVKVLCIDPDELRCEFSNYDGRNSYLFQGAVSILVDKIIDLAYEWDQSFILDGTLSNPDRARKNIGRALRHGRTVQILYVYLDPLQAWEFVRAREIVEGRRIPPEEFIGQYFAAREVVNSLKRELGPDISVDLLQKPIRGSERLFRAGIDQIDNHIPETYDRKQLAELLGVIDI
jgi:predicted ABC-type ATPase